MNIACRTTPKASQLLAIKTITSHRQYSLTTVALVALELDGLALPVFALPTLLPVLLLPSLQYPPLPKSEQLPTQSLLHSHTRSLKIHLSAAMFKLEVKVVALFKTWEVLEFHAPDQFKRHIRMQQSFKRYKPQTVQQSSSAMARVLLLSTLAPQQNVCSVDWSALPASIHVPV